MNYLQFFKIILYVFLTQKGPLNLNHIKNRRPHSAFQNHYQFEQEVLSANYTAEVIYFFRVLSTICIESDLILQLNKKLTTIVVWTGLTYGFEQDRLKFIFDALLNRSGELLVPNSINHVPVTHVQNLAR